MDALALAVALGLGAPDAALAQNPPGGAPPPGARIAGRGRGVQVMTLATTAWPDGGRIPDRYSQAGAEVSPPVAWSGVPDSVASFVLLVHDADAAVGNGLDDVLHWLVWNIPGTARALPEALGQGAQLADGTRQISVTGPRYRGPGAAASGPVHHYLFELYALDAVLDTPPVGAPPPATRAAVVAAMAGHVRGKAVLVGLFKRPPLPERPGGR